MPKPTKFTYEKKDAFRDAFYFIIVCEGQNREPDYFRFFDGISSRVKIVSVESDSFGPDAVKAKGWISDLATSKITEVLTSY